MTREAKAETSFHPDTLYQGVKPLTFSEFLKEYMFKLKNVFIFAAFNGMPQNIPQTIVILSQEHGQHDSSLGTLI